MNGNFTRLASVLMCIAFGCLPLAGQETVVMQTGIDEKLGMELRAAVPSDSSITYSTKGEYVYKHVTMREDGNYHSTKRYKWGNSGWIEDESVPDVWVDIYYVGAPEVKVEEGDLRFFIPSMSGRGRWYWSPEPDYEAMYDSRGNLTELNVSNQKFTLLYDELNNVVVIDGYWNGVHALKYRYEYYAYTAFPYKTLFESLDFDGAKGQWVAGSGGKHVRTFKSFQRENGNIQPRLLSDEKYVADATGGWVGDEKHDLAYDGNGNRSVIYHYVWYGNRWTQVMYTVFYPNALVPNVETGNNNPVGDTNKGSFDVNITVPADSVASGSFVIKFPGGFTPDETGTQPGIGFGDFTLVITKQEDNSWLLEFRLKGTRSTALRSEDVARTLAHIAYTVDDTVKRGTYDVTVHSILFETPGGDAIVEPALTVPVQLNREGVGNETIALPTIRSYGNTLYVRTIQPITLNIYTPTGALFRRQTLSAGESVVTLPPGTYFVQTGETVKKILIR